MKKQEKSEVSSIPPQAGPDIAAFMFRIEQKLAFLEKKMDSLLGQAPARSFQANQPPVPAPLHRHHDARHGHGHAPAKTFDAKPHFAPVASQQVSQILPGVVPPAQSQGPSRENSRGRRERILHKTVCADCQKDCEVPFKPTGERPVYCKECFSNRKSNRQNKAPSDKSPEMVSPKTVVETPVPVMSERKVTVTKKGVGRVTVSEIAPPSAREASPRGKVSRPAPAKKSRR